MKVAIDPWTLSPRFRHQGTYVYAWKLLSEFQRLATTRTELDFCLFTTPHGGNDANHFAESTGFKLKASSFLDYHRLWRLGLNSIAARRSRADVLFAPTVSAVPIGQVPVVTTIHDATPVVMPSHSLAGNSWLRMLLWSAARFSTFIITDSECSRQDLIRICGVPESRIAMVYLGFDNALFNDKDAPAPESAAVLKRMGVNRPYIMHHGTIQPRKNLARLIKAFDLMLSTNKDLEVDLVLPGKVGWEHGEIFELSRRWSHERGKVIMPGVVADQDLPLLIKAASLVVIPSLYEGFCLPMVESMACGTPTIAARASCLPEVSGGVLRYFDPWSIENMAECIQLALTDSQLRSVLTTRGKEQAGKYSWRKCAEQTWDVLCNVSRTRV